VKQKQDVDNPIVAVIRTGVLASSIAGMVFLSPPLQYFFIGLTAFFFIKQTRHTFEAGKDLAETIKK
jgi:hypothetical protein